MSLMKESLAGKKAVNPTSFPRSRGREDDRPWERGWPKAMNDASDTMEFWGLDGGYSVQFSFGRECS